MVRINFKTNKTNLLVAKTTAIFDAASESVQILSSGQNLASESNPYITKEYSKLQQLTGIYAGGRLLGTEKGNTETENYGIALDIGTTTLVATLVDIETGHELATVSRLNPQATRAHDVLSRIKVAAEPEGLSMLYSTLIFQINWMIRELTAAAEVNKAHIYEIVFSGNPCMLHLALNVNPAPLGKYPYRPVVTGGNWLRSIDHNIDIAEFGLIYIPPIISAYVGADITSGILAAQLDRRPGITLLIDIGTNGEMVLATDGKMIATSTAAGPAFEGMNITHGQRAENGAIESFQIDDDGQIHYETIGNRTATGICGSGLLDIVSSLVVQGVVDQNGKLNDSQNQLLPDLLRSRLIVRDGKLVFQITDTIWLTQTDLRQVQLAKGAIRAGIEFLLSEANIPAKAVERVLIAGSFGYHLKVNSLINIGLIPEEFQDKVEMVGNTSKTGAQAFLLNQFYREAMTRVIKDVTVLELESFPNFDRVFVQSLSF